MSLYPDVPNADLLQRIPLDARVVLDVGCGTGSLGAAYRRLNPRALLLGIDKDPAAAAIAADAARPGGGCGRRGRPPVIPAHSRIDCIVYGDILEHLADPWQVLHRHIAALNDDGTILICIPNVEHWSFAARLLHGTWDYEPTGLLDETHLRWFSLDSMRRSLLAAGLSLCDVHPRVFDPEKARAFVTAMTPALLALNTDPQEYLTRSSALQYVWRARKQATIEADRRRDDARSGRWRLPRAGDLSAAGDRRRRLGDHAYHAVGGAGHRTGRASRLHPASRRADGSAGAGKDPRACWPTDG